jgi:hypothetical protein
VNKIFEDMATMRDDPSLSVGKKVDKLRRYRGWSLGEVAAACGETADVVRAVKKGGVAGEKALRILDILSDPFVMRPTLPPNISKQEVADYLRYISGQALDSDDCGLWLCINDARTVQASKVDRLIETLSGLCQSPSKDAKRIKRSLMDCVAENDAKARRYGFMSVCKFIKQRILDQRNGRSLAEIIGGPNV